MPDIVTSKTFIDGEKGITAAKLNQIISGAVIQPAFYSAKPSSATLDPTDVLLELKGTGAFAQITGAQIASSVAGQLTLADATQNGMLRQVSGLTTDVVDGTNHCVPLASFAGITQMRLRSFNAIGNPTFEVDQRNAGNTLINPNNGMVIDRIFYGGGGTFAANFGQQSATLPDICVPGTNFRITRSFFRVTLTTQLVSPAAGNYLQLIQKVEGPRWRELSNDVHSLQVLVRSSVAGLTFGLALQDNPATPTRSLTKLATITTANTWTLLTFPNLPIWPAAGIFSALPGNIGYLLNVTLMAGSSLTSGANDTWQTGNLIGALGQSNFCASPVNSTFDIAFVQHEPGALCTTPIDSPFDRNYDDCLRYFCKSFDYGVKPGTVSTNGRVYGSMPANSNAIYAFSAFKKQMAKAPTVTAYSPPTGTINTVRDEGAGSDRGVSSTISPGETGFGGFTFGTANASATVYDYHYIADTGW